MSEKQNAGAAGAGTPSSSKIDGLDGFQDREKEAVRKLAPASVRYKMLPLFEALPPPERDCEQSSAQREFCTRILTDGIKVDTLSPPADGNPHRRYVAMLWFEGDAGLTPRWLTMPLAELKSLLEAHAVAFGPITAEPGAPREAEASQ